MDEHLLTIDRIPLSAARRTPPFEFRPNSAPISSIITRQRQPPEEFSDSNSRSHIVFLASIIGLLLLYLIAGIAVFICTTTNDFSGTKTSAPIDALYFTIVTLCTIGYGDIVPNTTFTKLFTSIFILVGFVFLGISLHMLGSYVHYRQEAVLLDEEKGRMMSTSTKVCLALGVAVFFIGVGTIGVHFLEEMSWVNSFYLAVASVTTVGYGDYAFETVKGRCFAVVWLLLSTLAVARAFFYLFELGMYRRNTRNRRVAKQALEAKMTIGDLIDADLDHDGSLSKAEYVICKLRSMGKISEKDVMEISGHYDMMENNFRGKMAIVDLLGEDDSSD